ncbi:Fic family protein [Mediterraneibacter glycyrrhizinilyticus]|nr:Fic family protein [Mediterraneibacter glycyrrhizinilyticus]MBM6855296.1 Fic family protein [Mediterraneibacter glycyrrhizinilyticus]
MRNYDFKKRYAELLLPDIVAAVAKIHEYRGEQRGFAGYKGEVLSQLSEIARIQSAEASNRMEGIYVSDERLKKIVKDKTMPKTKNEKEIAGYRDVLNTIHDNYNYIPVKSSIFLQLYRELFKFSGHVGEGYKASDKVSAHRAEAENESMRFSSVSIREIAENIEALCDAFGEIQNDPDYDLLLVIPMFTLDFLCIHPFDKGNGRMSRLLTLLLLYRSDYTVGMYISIEKLIEQTKTAYYRAIQDSSEGWREEKNDYLPFVRYMLKIIAGAYQQFSLSVQLLAASGMSKPERIREVIKENSGKITRAEIMKKCPNVSQVTVERTLTDLVKKREILKLGGGRYTAYTWNRERK